MLLRSSLLRRFGGSSNYLTSKATTSFVQRSFASVGDKIPSDIELYHQFPPKKINLAEYCADKSVILLGLPGAFTPT